MGQQSFLDNISQIKNITWGATDQWDVKFENMPESEGAEIPTRFRDFFPAVTVQQSIATFDFAQVEFIQSEIELPVASRARFVVMEFIDDSDHSLENWLRDWFNEIFPDGGSYVSPIKSIAKVLYINKLNRQRKVVNTDTLLVIPYKDMKYIGDSEHQAQKFNVTFLVLSSFKRH